MKGRGFRGGSDEKMRTMWLGIEIVVVGLPPLVQPFGQIDKQTSKVYTYISSVILYKKIYLRKLYYHKGCGFGLFPRPKHWFKYL